MNIKYTLCGFSIETDELEFEIELDESKKDLINLFKLAPDDPFVDIQDIKTEVERTYFENKYRFKFDSSLSYSVHMYQV